MDIKNLKEGQIINSYSELCRLLNIKKKSGNSKILQLWDLKRYFDYYKENNKFIIKQIYKQPYKELSEKYIQIFILKILYNSCIDIYKYKDNNKKWFVYKINLNIINIKQELLKSRDNVDIYNNYIYDWNININKFIYKNKKLNHSYKLDNKDIDGLDILINRALKSSGVINKDDGCGQFPDIQNYYSIFLPMKKYIKEKIENVFISEDNYVLDRNPSKAERMIEKWLWKHKINYSFEYRFCDNEYPDINGKRFDFAIFFNNKLVCLLEYDGVQHFEPIENFGGIGTLKKIQENDAIKNNYCDVKQYNLIRISYKNCCDKNGNITFRLYDELNKKVLSTVYNEFIKNN